MLGQNKSGMEQKQNKGEKPAAGVVIATAERLTAMETELNNFHLEYDYATYKWL